MLSADGLAKGLKMLIKGPNSESRSENMTERFKSSLPIPLFRVLKRLAYGFRKAQTAIGLFENYIDDLVRYFSWSHTGREDSYTAQSSYALLKQYHGIEKGLSLNTPRPGFGQKKVQALLSKIDAYEKNPDHDPTIVKAAVDSLIDYSKFNAAQDISFHWLNHWLDQRNVEEKNDTEANGGVIRVSRSDIKSCVEGVGEEFFLSRHSIRNFSGEEVPLEVIEKAADLARKTPSVCNRQGPRVHCFKNAAEALKWQSGNAGFGHLASRALVITSDIQAFSSIGERHQPFIDGGLYAMSIVYALHSLGYGSCMLAWDQTRQHNHAARKALNIPDNEVIIMMIAVGSLPDDLLVANAFRRPLTSSLFIH